MPEILKSGLSVNADFYFTCKFCFCEWKAKKEEVEDFKYSYALSSHYANMNCPECGEKTPLRNIVTKNVQKEETQ